MILRLRVSHILVSVYLCTTVTSAWPWPPSLPGLEGIIQRRQDDGDKDSSSAAAKTTGAKPTDSPSAKSAAATTGKPKSTAKASGTAKGTAAKTTATKKQQDSDLPFNVPPGAVNMVTPSVQAQSTYFKIGVDSVTFVWNYTTLSVTPSKINVLASCSANEATYTLASNQSFEETGSVVWDTRPDETGTAPLLSETYTLIIHDAQKAITDTPDPGSLAVYNQYRFGMYIPQKYTPRSEWKCATCNAALSDTDRQAIKFMLGMCTITILSFTWFVGGFGAIL